MSVSGTQARGLVTAPGTANTSRPMSSAWSAVIIDPLPSAPSTITTARDRPATIRFRAGNRNGSAGVPGGYSLTMAPAASISWKSLSFCLG